MMTTTGEKRLFIGGLVKGVTEEEIVEKFSRFGQVSGIEIKTRVSDTDSKTFAYLNLIAEENAFKKCFTAYNNTKWKGGQLKLQFAKESFLSKLKKEQAEAKTSREKGKGESTSVHKSPALGSDRTAVPGTPMDDNGTWVMGKYSRVLPVLNIRKPGTRKIVTVDPSKMSHCVKKLKADDYDAEKHSDLTWRLEETTSDINKRRQGQFPEVKAPMYHSTPKEPTGGNQESIFSRLQGLAVEEQVSDIEMEVVPAGNTAAVSKITVHNGYDSDVSASSADTDEIVFKASGKKVSAFTAKKSKTVAEPKMKKKQSPQKDPDQFSDDLVFSSNLSTPFNKSIGKKTPESIRTNKESQAKNHKPEIKAVNKEENKAPQFQFVKAPELKGKALKKSAKLSQGKVTSIYEHSDHEDLVLKGPTTIDRRTSTKRTPEFKGLGMLSSDSEDDGLPTRQATGPENNKLQDSGKETTVAIAKCTRTPSSSSEQKETQKDVSSDSEDTDNVLSHSKAPEKSVRKQSGEATKMKKSGLLSCDHDTAMLSHKPVKEKQTEALDSSKGLNQTAKDTQLSLSPAKERKKTVHSSDVMENVSLPVAAKTGSSAAKRKESVGQLRTKEDTSEFDSGLSIDPSSLAAPLKKRKKVLPVSSDDSDLDDNDFEKVGKKLAARALGKRQPGAGPVTDASFRSEDNPNKTRKRKLSQGEEGHLTSLQKSHQAYGKIQQEKKKKENLITKTLREGRTESKHIKFSDSEEEDEDVGMKPAKMTLFSDSDSDSDSESDIDFSLRPQFEGSKGKKLFDLQSRIMDKRFRFDEDFQSDSDGDEDTKTMEQESEDEMGTERRRNQEILEKVLGYKPRQRSRLVYEGMSKRRYNPDAAVDHVHEKKPEKRKKVEREEMKPTEPSDREEHQQNLRPDKSQEDVEEDSSSDSEEETDHSVDGESGPENNEQDSEEESNSEVTEQTTEAKDASAECRKQDKRDESGRIPSTVQKESLKDLFSGGSAFTFFGTPDVEDMDESEALTSSKKEKVEKEDMEEEEEEEEEEKESEEEEDKESEEEESVLDKCRVPESDRPRPSLQPQPSFMVARDDPRLTAAVRFFKRPHAEEFEELSERWGDERQKIMQLVRDRHKKACRKERQMKQGMKSRPFVKTKMKTSGKGKNR